MIRTSKGFTLIEIAIVLVIIGLLLGGVLKGQELITGARVRNLISQQDGIKAAFFGFQDRYRALPGDYASADANVNCPAPGCPNGNGNGRIEKAVSGSPHEEIFAWTHLTAAGFMNGSYAANSAETSPTDTNTPKNPYSVYIELVYDNTYGIASPAPAAKHNLKTGNQVPAEIIAEVDRKIDDGKPFSGAFQFSTFGGATAANCAVSATDANSAWKITGTTATDCGAASVF